MSTPPVRRKVAQPTSSGETGRTSQTQTYMTLCRRKNNSAEMDTRDGPNCFSQKILLSTNQKDNDQNLESRTSLEGDGFSFSDVSKLTILQSKHFPYMQHQNLHSLQFGFRLEVSFIFIFMFLSQYYESIYFYILPQGSALDPF